MVAEIVAVDTEQDAQTAIALVWKVKGVDEVINELIINPKKGFWDTAGDSFVKRNLEARLLITKDVMVINYSIDVQNGTAYLIGRVKDKGELNRVMNVARTTKGVKHIVSHLQLETDIPPAPGAAANTGPADASIHMERTVPITPANDGPVPQDSTRVGTVDAPDSIDSAPLAPKAH